MKEYMLPCMFKKYIGIECFGCGIQRSIALILHGEFMAAFKMYPAVYPMILLGGFVVFNFFRPWKHATKVVWGLGLLMAFAMVSNYIAKYFLY